MVIERRREIYSGPCPCHLCSYYIFLHTFHTSLGLSGANTSSRLGGYASDLRSNRKTDRLLVEVLLPTLAAVVDLIQLFSNLDHYLRSFLAQVACIDYRAG